MLQQILRVADAQLAQIVVDGHPGLLAKLLAQRALAALLLLAETLQNKGRFRLAASAASSLSSSASRCVAGIIRRVAMALNVSASWAKAVRPSFPARRAGRSHAQAG
jgi:Na+(H+)/acetate symporter ActP